jgi:alcohol dehydrogenase YqhD (iron-dependent ADH family)
MSPSCVITAENGWKKLGCTNDCCRPRFAIMDPELTMTLSDYQTACGCVDILMHTMERWFYAEGSMNITEGIAETLLRTVMKHALILNHDPQNYASRAR